MTYETHPLIKVLCEQAVMRDGQPWFLASDVGKMLGYGEPSKILGKLHDRHNDEFGAADVCFLKSETNQQRRHGRAFSLGGLVKVAAHAKTQRAAILREWLAHLIAEQGDVVEALARLGSKGDEA